MKKIFLNNRVKLFKQSSNKKFSFPSNKKFSSIKRLYTTNEATVGKNSDDYYQPAPAIDYISEMPIIKVDGVVARCDGGGPLGHPAVFIELETGKETVCGYCGLRYEQEHHH